VSGMVFAWGLFLTYVVVTSLLALRGMKKTTSLAGYAIGNKDMGPVLVGVTLASSVASTATFVINPGFVYVHGVSALMHFGLAATSGVTIGLIVLSKGFRRHGDQTSALTLPHWVGARYDSAALRTFFAIVNLFLAISFVVLIIKGSALVMVATLGLGYVASVVVITLFVFTYILIGGTYAHAYTNFFQGVLMIGVAVLIVGSGLPLLSDGVGPFLDKIAAQDPNLVKAFNPKSPLYSDVWEVLITPFIVGFGLVCQPHILTKALYVRSERDLNRYLLVGASVGLIFACMLFAGLYARVTLPNLGAQDAVMATYIKETFAPLLGVPISIALLAAGMSTMDGILVSASSIAGNDLFLGALGDKFFSKMSQDERAEKALAASRYILGAMGVIALVIALDPPVFVGLFAQFGVYGVVAASVAPLTFGIFVKEVNRRDVMASAVAGLGVHLGLYVYYLGFAGRTFVQVNPSITASAGAVTAVLLLGVATLVRRQSTSGATSAV
jgi:sodium/pantothenate symporter